MNMAIGARTVVGWVSLMGAAVAAPSDGPPATASQVPEAVRPFLRQQMDKHGEDLRALVHAVVLLQHDRVEELAWRLAKEPGIAPPLEGGGQALNRELPPDFFTLQDNFQALAVKLTSASSMKDADLALTFGQLTESCVRCHSLYLQRK